MLTRLIELARPCAARSLGCIELMRFGLTHSRPVTRRGLGAACFGMLMGGSRMSRGRGKTDHPNSLERRPMDRNEALSLLKGGAAGVAEWNRRRRSGEEIPSLVNADLSGADLTRVDSR